MLKHFLEGVMKIYLHEMHIFTAQNFPYYGISKN